MALETCAFNNRLLTQEGPAHADVKIYMPITLSKRNRNEIETYGSGIVSQVNGSYTCNKDCACKD